MRSPAASTSRGRSCRRCGRAAARRRTGEAAGGGDDQRHARAVARRGVVVPVADQQEREEAGQLPEEDQLDQVARQHHAQHRAHEGEQEREEARHRVGRRHVVARVEHQERGRDPGDQHREHPGEAVHAQREVEAEGGQPGARRCGSPRRWTSLGSRPRKQVAARAMAPASQASALRALAGSSPAATLPAKGSATRAISSGDRRDPRRGALQRQHQPQGAAELGARQITRLWAIGATTTWLCRTSTRSPAPSSRDASAARSIRP